MYDSPSPLRDRCLDYIRDVVKDTFARPTDEPPEKRVANTIVLDNLHDAHLTARVSEQLLESLSEDDRLDDQTLAGVFRPTSCTLEKVRIPNASKLSTAGLRVLKGHRITELTVEGLVHSSINELIGCLGEWTLNNLSALNVAHSSFMSTTKVRSTHANTLMARELTYFVLN